MNCELQTANCKLKTASLIIVIAVCALAGCNKKTPETGLYSLQLNTIDHRQFSLNTLSENKAAVIIFLQPECPFCNSYGKTLRLLDSMYTSKGISFTAVVSGKNYPDAEINDYLAKHRLHFRLLLDPDFALQKTLTATTTPEAFLVNKDGQVLYRGMIDNWGYEIGKVRPNVSEHYLTDAMDAFLQNKPISVDSTKAIGCYIE